MANYADYLPGGAKDPSGGMQAEIEDAQNQQQARQVDATPVDWETRYKELEKLNSRQAQTLGDYRKVIDNYIVNPTPNEEPTPEANLSPITADELYEDPNAAIQRAVESHPAIQEARNLKEQMIAQERDNQFQGFASRHTDYQEIGQTPEFQNWVMDNPTRQDLFQRADAYDFSAADALFSLYKAEKGIAQVQNQQEIDHANLVSSSGEMVVEPAKYSRSEYVNTYTRARQGDLQAEEWIKRNAAGYRMALADGNVRD